MFRQVFAHYDCKDTKKGGKNQRIPENIYATIIIRSSFPPRILHAAERLNDTIHRLAVGYGNRVLL